MMGTHFRIYCEEGELFFFLFTFYLLLTSKTFIIEKEFSKDYENSKPTSAEYFAS